MRKLFIICLIGISFLNVSCNDEDDDKDTKLKQSSLTIKVVKNIPANPTDGTGSGHYTFFSFKNNAIIPVSDSATLKWDIGFLGTNIIVNSGISGPGGAGAQIYVGIFDDLSDASGTTFKVDNASSLAISTGSGTGWYNYNSTVHVISPIPGRVLVFRTANGKFAKMEILSYYKDMPFTPTSDDVARYYSFRYAYQDDGSAILN